MSLNNKDEAAEELLRRPVGPVRNAINNATMALNVVGTLLTLAIVILVNADVIGRGALGLPLSGVPEMVSMSIVAIVFLQVAHTFRMGKLTRSDAVLGMVESRSPRFRALFEFIFYCSAIGIMAQLLSASWPLFLKSWTRGTFEGTIGDFTAPIWPVKFIILVGCVALIVQLMLSATDALRTFWAGQQDGVQK